VFIITLVFYTIIALGIYFLPTGISCTGTPSRRGDLRAQHSAGLDADRLGRGPRLGAHQFRRWPNPDHPRRGLVSLVHESDPAPLFCAGMPQITNRRLSLADRRVQTKGKVEAMLKFVRTNFPERRWCRRYRSRPSRRMPQRRGRDRDRPADVAPAAIHWIVRLLPIGRPDDWTLSTDPSAAKVWRPRKLNDIP
jgi:hypothetical protein